MVRTVALATATMAFALACSSRRGAGDTDSSDASASQSNAATPSSGSSDATVSVDGGTADERGPTILTNESLDVAGETRTYLLATPRTYSEDTKYPLVLALHGDGDDGPKMRAAFPFDDVSADGAIVAYPTGNPYGWDLYDPAGTDPDVAYLVALVSALESRFNIDSSRVYGTGFSSGAFMVNQVACRRPTLFRAIAPQSGGAPSEPQDPAASKWNDDYTRCANQTMGNGPAAMVIHGTADGTVPFAGGDFTANYWAFINGCGTTRSVGSPSPCLRQDGCPTAEPVEFCPIDNLNHAVWPGAAAAIWGFFQRVD